MAKAYTGGRLHNRYHFAVLDHRGRCTKYRRRYPGDPEDQIIRRTCSQPQDGDRHFYYPCRKDPDCGFKSWSLEMRENHEHRDHV